jgi:hypothetical protein
VASRKGGATSAERDGRPVYRRAIPNAAAGAESLRTHDSCVWHRILAPFSVFWRAHVEIERRPALKDLITAVGVERWGQRAGQLAWLLNKHPVAVSRSVKEAARRRMEDRAFGEETNKVDQALSAWFLDVSKGGEIGPNLDKKLE